MRPGDHETLARLEVSWSRAGNIRRLTGRNHSYAPICGYLCEQCFPAGINFGVLGVAEQGIRQVAGLIFLVFQ